jgi:hypothetical protein
VTRWLETRRLALRVARPSLDHVAIYARRARRLRRVTHQEMDERFAFSDRGCARRCGAGMATRAIAFRSACTSAELGVQLTQLVSRAATLKLAEPEELVRPSVVLAVSVSGYPLPTQSPEITPLRVSLFATFKLPVRVKSAASDHT